MHNLLRRKCNFVPYYLIPHFSIPRIQQVIISILTSRSIRYYGLWNIDFDHRVKCQNSKSLECSLKIKIFLKYRREYISCMTSIGIWRDFFHVYTTCTRSKNDSRVSLKVRLLTLRKEKVHRTEPTIILNPKEGTWMVQTDSSKCPESPTTHATCEKRGDRQLQPSTTTTRTTLYIHNWTRQKNRYKKIQICIWLSCKRGPMWSNQSRQDTKNKHKQGENRMLRGFFSGTSQANSF